MSVKRRIHDLNAKGILDLRRLHQHSTDLELVIAAIEFLKDDSDDSDDSDASDEELLQICAIAERIFMEPDPHIDNPKRRKGATALIQRS